MFYGLITWFNIIEWYDFYLISQMARQGTVAPTHFNVIWDRTGFV